MAHAGLVSAGKWIVAALAADGTAPSAQLFGSDQLAPPGATGTEPVHVRSGKAADAEDGSSAVAPSTAATSSPSPTARSRPILAPSLLRQVRRRGTAWTGQRVAPRALPRAG